MCALNVTGVVGMQAYARTSTDPLTFSQVPPHVYNAVLAPTTTQLVRSCAAFELHLIQHSSAEGASVNQGRLMGTLCTLPAVLMVAIGVGASTCTACRAGTFNDSAGVFSKQGLCFRESEATLPVAFNKTALPVAGMSCLLDSKAH